MIDDRRIKVDFSQSVSKLMPRMKNMQQQQKSTYKSGDMSQKNKQLVKFKNNKEYFGDKKYDMVVK